MLCQDAACALLGPAADWGPVAETLGLGADSPVTLWDNKAES